MASRPFTASLTALLMVIWSCGGDDINLTCPDPLGSDAKSIQTYALSCFQSEFDGCFEFRLNGESPYLQSVYIGDISEAPLIVDVGEVSCLGEITGHQYDSWQYVVPVIEKHGYVFKMKDGTLGRLFIDSFESPTEIMKVNFTRQYPY